MLNIICVLSLIFLFVKSRWGQGWSCLGHFDGLGMSQSENPRAFFLIIRWYEVDPMGLWRTATQWEDIGSERKENKVKIRKYKWYYSCSHHSYQTLA